jgi:hypothetical protein
LKRQRQNRRRAKTSFGGFFDFTDELRRADQIIIWMEDIRSPGKLIPMIVERIPHYQKFIKIEFVREV